MQNMIHIPMNDKISNGKDIERTVIVRSGVTDSEIMLESGVLVIDMPVVVMESI